MPYLVFNSSDIESIVDRVKQFAFISYLIGGHRLDFHISSKYYGSPDESISTLGIALCHLTKSRRIIIVNFPEDIENDDIIIKTFKKEYLGIVEYNYDKLFCKSYMNLLIKIWSIKYLINSTEFKVFSINDNYLTESSWTIVEIDEYKDVIQHSLKTINDYLNDKEKDANKILLNYDSRKLIKRKF